MKNSEQIYHEILMNLVCHEDADVVKRVSSVLNSVFSVMGEFVPVVKAADSIKNALTTMINEKDVLIKAALNFASLHIIVIDDLERLSNEIPLEEVLGIIEEIKNCPNLKVIIIANKKEVRDNKKQILDKYAEKIIDREFIITEPSDDIKWEKLGLDAEFTSEFMRLHKVKNLRTLQKAQHFYEDVKLNCGVSNEAFLEVIRMHCYAIVVEDIEKIYFRQDDSGTDDSSKNLLNELHNELYFRLHSYLVNSWSSNNLSEMLISYYRNLSEIDEQLFDAEYQIYLKSEEKSNYFKSEAEISGLVLGWKALLSSATNTRELLRYASECVIWSEVIEKPYEDILQDFGERFGKMLWQNAINENKSMLVLDTILFDTECNPVRKKATEIAEDLREKYVRRCIKLLLSRTLTNEKAYEYSRQLKECQMNLYYKDYVDQYCFELLKKDFFPIDNMDQQRYYTCYNIMSILKKTDSKRFDAFVKSIMPECDKMARYRIRELIKHIDDEH